MGKKEEYFKPISRLTKSICYASILFFELSSRFSLGYLRLKMSQAIDSFHGRLVLVRHGESTWNKENRYIGWTDVPLTDLGHVEAQVAGKTLLDKNHTFDVVYTSLLSRSISTAHRILEEMDLCWIEEFHEWRLNERMYGDMIGYTEQEALDKYGFLKVEFWRNSYDVPPPPYEFTRSGFPGQDKRYNYLDDPCSIPRTESLKDVVQRVAPLLDRTLKPQVLKGKKVLVVSHAKTICALVKLLEGINDIDIMKLNIPRATPLVYDFNESFEILVHNKIPARFLQGCFLNNEWNEKSVAEFENASNDKPQDINL